MKKREREGEKRREEEGGEAREERERQWTKTNEELCITTKVDRSIHTTTTTTTTTGPY